MSESVHPMLLNNGLQNHDTNVLIECIIVILITAPK